MTTPLKAEIIAIGTELLLGDLTDTNSVYLARQMRDLGIYLYFKTTVGDNRGRIAEVVRLALGRADIVITCGGLGPTVDDMTRGGVADATGRELVFHEQLLARIADRFTAMRAQMTDNNRLQAYVPAEAVIIENPVGTAPAFVVELGSQAVISLPGVPRELRYLFEHTVKPYLISRYGAGSTHIVTRVLKSAGIGESWLDDTLGPELLESPNPTIGLAAHAGQVDIRITARADSSDGAQTLLDNAEASVRERVGRFIYGQDEASLEDALAEELQTAGAELRVVEIGVPEIVPARLAGPLQARGVPISIVRTESATDVAANAETARAAAERLAEDAGQGAVAALVIYSAATGAADHADTDALSAVAVRWSGQTRSREFGFAGDADIAQQILGTWPMATLWRLLRDNRA